MHASHSRFADVYVTLYVPHSQGTLSTRILISLNAKAWKRLLNSKKKEASQSETFWTTYLFIHSIIYLSFKTAISDVQG